MMSHKSLVAFRLTDGDLIVINIDHVARIHRTDDDKIIKIICADGKTFSVKADFHRFCESFGILDAVESEA